FSFSRDAGVDDSNVSDVTRNDVGTLGDQLGKAKRRALTHGAFVVHLVDDDAFGVAIRVASAAAGRSKRPLLLLPIIELQALAAIGHRLYFPPLVIHGIEVDRYSVCTQPEVGESEILIAGKGYFT